MDARYLGQSYELNVAYSPKVMEDFHRRHLQVYGYSNDGLTVEIVNLRVRGRARYSLPPLPEFPVEGPEPAVDALIQEKQVLDGGQSQQLKFYVRAKLCPGNRLQGPAVVLEYSATTWVPAGFTAEVDTRLNLIIEPQVAEA